jgi:hypothetical protein
MNITRTHSYSKPTLEECHSRFHSDTNQLLDLSDNFNDANDSMDLLAPPVSHVLNFTSNTTGIEAPPPRASTPPQREPSQDVSAAVSPHAAVDAAPHAAVDAAPNDFVDAAPDDFIDAAPNDFVDAAPNAVQPSMPAPAPPVTTAALPAALAPVTHRVDLASWLGQKSAPKPVAPAPAAATAAQGRKEFQLPMVTP